MVDKGDNTLALIEALRDYEELYNKKHQNYNKRKYKDSLWKKISENLKIDGKKGKKKNKSITLQHFLANGNSGQTGVTHVALKARREDSDDEPTLPTLYQLPTAPRANRIYDDDNSIPNKPPYLVYLTNLPFDIKEDDIMEFFMGYRVESVRLPREEGEYGRLRGFGYVQFETRDDLINALSLPDPQIRNRRIRINLTSENDQNKERRNRNSRYEGFGSGSSDNKDTSSWRREKSNEDDKGANRRTYSGYKDRGEKVARDNSAEPGSWRTGDRSNLQTSSPIVRRGADRPGFNERERFSSGRKQQNSPPRERPKLNILPRTLPLPEIEIQANYEDKQHEEEKLNKDIESDIESEKSHEQRTVTPDSSTQPKLKQGGVPAEKVFGGAKPVDTSAREKEIEERLEREWAEKLKLKEEEEEKEAKENEVDEKLYEVQIEKDEKNGKNSSSWRNDMSDSKQLSLDHKKYSPDQKGSSRKIDEHRGSNRDRDRRDYNRGFNRDNRNMDNRDRNDRDTYNRGRRDRDYSKDYKGNQRRDDRERVDNRDDKLKQKDKIERSEKPMPKYQPQGGPTLLTSNKYALFQDDDNSE